MLQKPYILTIMSTKGGVTKSTNVANLSAFVASCGLNVLMIDTDVQPTLSSYYHLNYEAPCGLFEFLVNKETSPDLIISKTIFKGLDIIKSNDPRDALSDNLRADPAGALRLKKLLSENFQFYDLIVIDTRGTRGITVDMAVMASDLVLSPIKPELLSAKEFMRGTLGLYNQLKTFESFGFTLPPVKAIISVLDNTNNAKMVVQTLKDLFSKQSETDDIQLLDLTIPSRVAYREASANCQPIHIHAPDQLPTIKNICCEIFPFWKSRFEQFQGGE